MRVHASCAAWANQDGYDAILLLGPPGSGKSDFLLRLIHRGFALIADDQVVIENNIASAPKTLAGMLEVRGLGIFRLPYIGAAPLRLVIRLGIQPARLPEPETHPTFNLPVVTIDPSAPSAPERAVLALQAATFRITQIAGAFTA